FGAARRWTAAFARRTRGDADDDRAGTGSWFLRPAQPAAQRALLCADHAGTARAARRLDRAALVAADRGGDRRSVHLCACGGALPQHAHLGADEFTGARLGRRQRYLGGADRRGLALLAVVPAGGAAVAGSDGAGDGAALRGELVPVARHGLDVALVGIPCGDAGGLPARRCRLALAVPRGRRSGRGGRGVVSAR